MDLEKKLFKVSLWVWLFCILLYFLLQTDLIQKLPGSVCVFYRVTGFYCPGCGGTRAFQCLMQGKLIESFCFHPLVPYGFLILFFFTVSHLLQTLSGERWKIGLRFHNWYLYGALWILGLHFVIENLLLLCGIRWK